MSNQRMHGLDRSTRCPPSGDVGLIRNNHNEEAGVLEPTHGVFDARQQLELLDLGRSDRTPIALNIGVYDAVPIEKDRPYHLVAFFWSFGCDTRQCQITVWNASA